MNGPTRPLRIEGYTLDVPASLKSEDERAYAAYFLLTFLGKPLMAEQTPILYNKFYGPNRNAVETQRIWRSVGHQAHEDAQRLLAQRTNTHQPVSAQTAPNPTDLVGLMSATEENPEFVAAFERTRTA